MPPNPLNFTAHHIIKRYTGTYIVSTINRRRIQVKFTREIYWRCKHQQEASKIEFFFSRLRNYETLFDFIVKGKCGISKLLERLEMVFVEEKYQSVHISETCLQSQITEEMCECI